MYLFIRLLPFLLAVITGAGIEFALFHPSVYVSIASLVILLTLVGGILILRRSFDSDRRALLMPPAVFLSGITMSLFFLPLRWPASILTHTLVLVSVLSVWVYFEEVYRYVYEPERYHQHALEHLTGYLGVMALAGFLAGIFGLRIFLNIRLIYLLPITLGLATLVSASVFAIQPISRASLWSLSAMFGLLLTEMTLAAHFLPTHYWVNSLIITIPFYVAMHLVRHELNATLTRAHIRRYALIGMISLTLVLVSAQWVL